LQLLPAFTEAETGCPVINIKPLLLDLDHALTIEKILKQVREDYAQWDKGVEPMPKVSLMGVPKQ
jgi:hypothetical protein